MKTIITLLFTLFLISSLASAQDTMYVYKSGASVSKRATINIDSITFKTTVHDTMCIYKSGSVINMRATTDIDSVIFYAATTVNPIPTANCGTVTDVDGNVYNTVTIGNQCWLQKNLSVTHYNDGTAISLVTDNITWVYDTTPAYCNYNNTTNADTINIYGRFYNWYAVNTGKLCPTGWHVPDSTEWNTLINYLGGASVAGGHLKEAGTTYWRSPNIGADNSSKFTDLPAGYRTGLNGNYYNLGSTAYFWGSTEDGALDAWFGILDWSGANVNQYSSVKVQGFSVRCLKN